MAKEKRRGGWIAPTILMLGIGSCVVMLPTTEKTPAEEAAQKEADKLRSAMYRCENETKSRIADPEGFETASYGDWRAMPDDVGDGIRFWFPARARNAFGALIWADFKCHATYDGKYWTAEISQE